MMNESVAVAILAGGLSSRMGQDKSLVQLGGKALIARVIENVRPLSVPVIIIANRPELHQAFGFPVYPDVLPIRSSLNGLYSAVLHSPSEYTFCIACDMPFLNPALIAQLISLRAGYDAVVPVVDNHPQAFHALYRKTCLAPMLRQLEANQLKIRNLYEKLNTCWVSEDTLRVYDPEFASFMNVNTPDALNEANSLL